MRSCKHLERLVIPHVQKSTVLEFPPVRRSATRKLLERAAKFAIPWISMLALIYIASEVHGVCDDKTLCFIFF